MPPIFPPPAPVCELVRPLLCCRLTGLASLTNLVAVLTWAASPEAQGYGFS
jgi:hypothetical protein